jgi:hypothetical protein
MRDRRDLGLCMGAHGYPFSPPRPYRHTGAFYEHEETAYRVRKGMEDTVTSFRTVTSPLELTRYIHLNPVRAGIVKDMSELDLYPWTGHSTLMGKVSRVWQDVEADHGGIRGVRCSRVDDGSTA